MTLKELLSWGFVSKEYLLGARKEYYNSEKDIWKLATQVAKERNRRALDPVVEALTDLQKIQGTDKKTKEFNKVKKDLLQFANRVGAVLRLLIRAVCNKFFSTILIIFK